MTTEIIPTLPEVETPRSNLLRDRLAATVIDNEPDEDLHFSETVVETLRKDRRHVAILGITTVGLVEIRCRCGQIVTSYSREMALTSYLSTPCLDSAETGRRTHE